MRTYLLAGALALGLLAPAGCAPVTKTERGGFSGPVSGLVPDVVSGAVRSAQAGTGISALAGGGMGAGGALGGAFGGVADGIYGHNRRKR